MQKNTSAQTKQEREYYLGLTEAQYQAQLKEKEDIEKRQQKSASACLN